MRAHIVLLEAHAAKVIKARHLAGDAQAADLLTKPLDRKRFVALRTYLMNTDAQVNISDSGVGVRSTASDATVTARSGQKGRSVACAGSPSASRRW